MHHLRIDLRDPHLLAPTGDDVLVVARDGLGETTDASVHGFKCADVAGSVCDCVVETLAAICVDLVEVVSLISCWGAMDLGQLMGVGLADGGWVSLRNVIGCAASPASVTLPLRLSQGMVCQ